MYGSTIGSLTCSMDDMIFRYGQVQGFSKCHKSYVTNMFGAVQPFLEPKLQKPGVKIPKWDPRSQIGVHMGFRKMDST